MSTVINEGVKMSCKEVTENLFTVAGHVVEHSSTAIEKPKGSIEEYLSIRHPPPPLN